MLNKTYCGYVAIVGRPNVGKSTLLNQMLSKKISITSHKPQTTRHRILGVKTLDAVQMIYVDTPGFHQGGEKLINRMMNKSVKHAINDVDVILFLVDSSRFFGEDQAVLELIQKQASQKPVILVVNKIDCLQKKSDVLPIIDELQKKMAFTAIVPISALKKDNLKELEDVITKHLPAEPHQFPSDYTTDRSQYFLLAEMIREKIFRILQQEVPYTTTVTINNLQKKEGVFHVDATIYVERDGQKKILIPHLKQIGTQARQDMEAILESKVFLTQWVKVKSQWSDNASLLQQFGYDE